MGEREFVLQRPRHRRRRRLAFTAEGHLVYVDKSKWGEKGGKGGFNVLLPLSPPTRSYGKNHRRRRVFSLSRPKKSMYSTYIGCPDNFGADLLAHISLSARTV